MTQQRKKIFFLFLSLILAFSGLLGTFSGVLGQGTVRGEKTTVGGYATNDPATIADFEFTYDLKAKKNQTVTEIDDYRVDDRLALDRIQVTQPYWEKLQSITAYPGGVSIPFPAYSSASGAPQTVVIDRDLDPAHDPIDSGAGAGSTTRQYERYEFKFKGGGVTPTTNDGYIRMYFKLADPSDPYKGHPTPEGSECGIPFCNLSQNIPNAAACPGGTGLNGQNPDPKTKVQQNVVCNWAKFKTTGGDENVDAFITINEPIPTYTYKKVGNLDNVQKGDKTQAVFSFKFKNVISTKNFTNMKFVAILPSDFALDGIQTNNQKANGKMNTVSQETLSGGRKKYVLTFNTFPRGYLGLTTNDVNFVVTFVPLRTINDSNPREITGYLLMDDYAKIEGASGLYELRDSANQLVARSTGNVGTYTTGNSGDNGDGKNQFKDTVTVTVAQSISGTSKQINYFDNSGFDTYKKITPGNNYTYRVEIINDTATPATSADAYEVFPDGTDAKSFKPHLSGPIQGTGTSDFTIKYCLSPNPNPTNPGSCTNWQTGNSIKWADVTAYQISLNAPNTVPASGAKFLITMETGSSNAEGFETAKHQVYFKKEVLGDWKKNKIKLTVGMNPRVRITTKYVKQLPTDPNMANATISGTAALTGETLNKTLTYPPGQTSVSEVVTYNGFNSAFARLGWTLTPNADAVYTEMKTEGITGGAGTNICEFNEDTPRNTTDSATHDYECTILYQIPPRVNNIAFRTEKHWDPNVTSGRSGLEFELQYADRGQTNWAAVPSSMLQTQMDQSCVTANPVVLTGASNTESQFWCVPDGKTSTEKYDYRIVEKEATPGALERWTPSTGGIAPVDMSAAGEVKATITNTFKISEYSVADPYNVKATWVEGGPNHPEIYLTVKRYASTHSATCTISTTEEIVTTYSIGATPVTDALRKLNDFTQPGWSMPDPADNPRKWVKTFPLTGLPKTDEFGCTFDYWIEATKVDGSDLAPTDYENYTKVDGDRGSGNPDDEIIMTYIPETFRVVGTKKWVGGGTLARPDVKLGVYVKDPNDPNKLILPHLHPNIVATPYYATCLPAAAYPTSGTVTVRDGDNPGNTEDTVVWCLPLKDRLGNQITYFVDEELGNGYAGAASLSLPSGVDTLGQKPANYTKSFENATTVVNTYTPQPTNAGGNPADDGKVIATVVWRCGTVVCPATVAKSDLTLELHRQWKSANGLCGGSINCGAMDEGLTLANKTVTLTNADAATHAWKATWPTGGEAVSLPNADPATGMTYYYTATPTGFDPNVWKFVSVENPVNGNAAPVLTFQYRVQNVEVQAKKVWVNGENSAEKAAALGNIRFTLQRRIKGTTGAWQSAILINEPGYETTNGAVILPDPNGGEVKWKTPKTNENGQEYEFNVKETPGTIPGFDVGVVAQPNPNELKFTVTNKYIQPTAVITVKKQWIGGQNDAAAGAAVAAFTLSRSLDGATWEVAAVTAGAGLAGTNPATITRPATELKWKTETHDVTGKPYQFKVDETTVPANFKTPEIVPHPENPKLFEFKNTYESPAAKQVGKKVWNGGDALGNRPTIQLQLERRPLGFAAPYQAVPAAELKATYPGQPAGEICSADNPVSVPNGTTEVIWCVDTTNADGTAYEYHVSEVAEPAGYTAANTDAMTVKNTFKVENNVSFTGTVAWIGGSGHRPANVLLELKRVQVDNANADIPGTEEAGFIADKQANQASTWKATWNGLANKNLQSGRNYRYYVDTSWTDPDFDKVKSLADQTVLGGPNTTDTVTFKYKGGGSLVGIKRWVGGWEDARFDVTLTLMRKGNGPFASWEHAMFTAGSSETAAVTLLKVDAATHLWQKEWSNVITTDANGLQYQFRIEEDVVPAGAYFEEIDDGNPMMVTNKFKAPLYDDGDPATQEDGTYVGKKFWLPDNSVAAPKIEMQLYRQAYNPTVAAGVAVGVKEPVGAVVDVTAADNWEHAFSGLVKYQESTGYEYKYWVDEVSVPAGFVKVVDAGNTTPQLENYDNTIYNKKDEPPNTVTLTKTWLNVPGGYVNNCEVSFTLLNDGVMVEYEADGMTRLENPKGTTGTAHTTFKWENLPGQSGAGYSIVETLGANCGSFNAGTVNPTSPKKTSFVATNTYTHNLNPIPAFKATKIWRNGQTQRRPINFTLHRKAGALDEVVPDAELAGGMGTCKTTATVTLTPTGTSPTSSAIEKQSATWCNLTRETDTGTPFVYYVTEAFVYSADAALWEAGPFIGDPTNVAGDGMSITNTFKPSKTSIVIHKEWTRAITANSVTVDVRKRVTSGVDAPALIGTQTLTQRDHADPGNPKIWTLPAIEVDAVNEKGQPLSYSIAETQLAGCNVPTYVGQDTGDITVKNDCDYQKATIQATVNWVGVTPVGTAPAVTLTFTNDKGLPSQTLSYPAGSDPNLMQSIQVDAVVLVGGTEQTVTWQVKQTFDIPTQADDYNTTAAAIQNVPPLTPGGTVTVDFTNTRKHAYDKVTVQKVWVGGPANKPATWLKLQCSTNNGLSKNDVIGASIKEVAAGTAATVTVEWDNIEQKDPVTGTYYKFYVVETDNAGIDATVDGYDKDETAERKVTNTWNGKPISITAEKEWTDSDPHPQIWFKLFRSIDGGTTKEDAGVPNMMVPAAAPFTVTWNNVPSADATGRDYTFYVQEVDSTGNDFTPAGYGKVESGLKVINSKSGMLTVDLTTDPYTPLPFEINVTDGGTLNYTEQIDNDAADLTRDNIVNVNNILPQPHTVKINGLDMSIWPVRAITCTERALGSASGTGVDLAITREQNGGELTGKFVIDNMPATSIVECHYDLQSRVGGQVFVSNETADNPPNPLPVYTYETTGSGYVGFNVPANGAPDNQSLLPGTYTVAQQNINGWVTMDVIVESSDPNRNPLISWTDRPATIAVPNGTGFESAVTFKVEPNDRVTVKFINGPANSVFIREINIPASSTQQFMIHGFASGIISPTKSILKSGLIPNGNRWQLTQGEVNDWELVDITCTERGTVGPLSTLVDIPNRTVHIGLDQGEAITCVFTNRAVFEVEEHYDPPVPGFTDLDVLPRTGFAPGRITNLIDQPAMKRYDTSPLRLTIPSMNVSLEVFGVPRTDGFWDVTWLGKNAGYIEGSAYPMQEGNSIITAHVWDEYNNPGPFFGLKELKYGDRFMLTAYGKTYIYEVRESERIAETEVDQLMTPKESGIWTTLMTCEAYDEGTARYDYRRFVRAVLIEIQ